MLDNLLREINTGLRNLLRSGYSHTVVVLLNNLLLFRTFMLYNSRVALVSIIFALLLRAAAKGTFQVPPDEQCKHPVRSQSLLHFQIIG